MGLPELAARLRLVGMDVVEVIPTAVGSADVTALVAERVVREALTGLAFAASLHRGLWLRLESSPPEAWQADTY